MRWFCTLILLTIIQSACARSSSGSRLLVVLEEAAEKAKYSTFWEDLKGRGFHVTFTSPKSDKLSLFQHGERLFDHLILLPPKSKGLGPSLTPTLLLQFINQNGNILLTLSGNSPTPPAISSLLAEFDIHLPQDRNSAVLDHFTYDASSAPEAHDVLLLPTLHSGRPGLRPVLGLDGTVAFPRAVGQELGASRPLLTPILQAKDTSYTHSLKDEAEYAEDPFAVGSQISLVTTMQARNSARFTVFGSLEALQDQWFDAEVKSGDGTTTPTHNRAFARQVSAWTFQELGVLKVGRVEHRLSLASPATSTNRSLTELGPANPLMYRIKNDITFDIEVSEYNIDVFKPFELNSGDALQLECTMLSPFYRLDLVPVAKTSNSTVFSSTFRLPDQHGIFRFEVNYKRPLFSNVNVRREVTVRHFAHDEWARSWQISGGWVWIAGISITIIGWIAFVGLWLWSAPTHEQDNGKKKQ